MKHGRVFSTVCTAVATMVLVGTCAVYAGGVERLFDEGRELQKAGKLEDALKKYGECLAMEPNYERAIFACGVIYFKLEDYAKAAQTFESLLVHQPANLRARLYAADSRERMGEVEKAKNEYRRILTDHPDNVTALIGLGRAEFMSGNRFAAVETFKKALTLQPSNKSLRTSIERLEASNLEYLKMSEELRRKEIVSAVNNAIAENAAEQARLREEAAARSRAEAEEAGQAGDQTGSSDSRYLRPTRAGREMGAGRRARGENEGED